MAVIPENLPAVIDAGPLSATFFDYSETGANRGFGAHNAWNFLPEGPLKTLLTTSYWNGEGDRSSGYEAFMLDAAKLGLKVSVLCMAKDVDTTSQYWDLSLPYPDMPPGYIIGCPNVQIDVSPSKSFNLHLEVMHSIIK